MPKIIIFSIWLSPRWPRPPVNSISMASGSRPNATTCINRPTVFMDINVSYDSPVANVSSSTGVQSFDYVSLVPQTVSSRYAVALPTLRKWQALPWIHLHEQALRRLRSAIRARKRILPRRHLLQLRSDGFNCHCAIHGNVSLNASFAVLHASNTPRDCRRFSADVFPSRSEPLARV